LVVCSAGHWHNRGNLMRAHLRLRRSTADHFRQWLQLWRDTVADLCSEELASSLIAKAEIIGERLLHAISSYHEPVVRKSAEATQGGL
jgi:truncated hemoglobin YjbI